MRINNINAEYNKNINKNINFKGGREVLRTISNPDSLASLIILESFVTGGRGAKAFKRGGFPEFRERFTDDLVSAVFWMKGVDMFNKIGDKIGKKILKLPTTDFDVGKDALRTPFNNVLSDFTMAKEKNEVMSLEKKLAAFKFTKIIASSLLAIGFVGFILPKINQTITDKLMSKHKKESVNSSQNALDSSKFKTIQGCSFEKFQENINQNKTQSFKGNPAQIMTTAAHCLENNKLCKLLTCDLGILTGRIKTARNKDEGAEYFFRDTSSSFFYYASTPLLYKLLQKLTGSSKITDIDPVCAKQLHQLFTKEINHAGGTMNVKDFESKIAGTLTEKSKKLLDELPFNSDVISLETLKGYIKDEKIIDKASKMAQFLQPEQAGVGKVLTKQQVQDVLKNGSVNSPEFMQNVYKTKFGETLTNPYKYIPMKKITKFRDNIDKYIQSVIDTATNKNDGLVDKKLLDNINKKSFAMSAGFRTVALGLSAITLGFIIPTVQYAITAKKTGKNEAPGLRKYEEN